ncbi:MAG: phosphatase PAP2 family protein [Acidobacteria bacterium]|nr:MAG: phosphatase PAP2 family protein [Acidobacteriota bacterium]
MRQMRTAEVVALVYFVYLPLAARLARTRRRPGWADAASLGIAAVSASLQWLGTERVATLVRDWAPGAFLLLAYWMSAPYKGAASPAFERWLLNLDRRLLGRALDGFATRAPRLLLEAFELAYITCYPFVPAGLLWLLLSGDPVDPNRFWTAVLIASLPCYGLLPWFHTAPPRAVEPDLPIERRGLVVRRFNFRLLDRTSVHANTFPSGHVASTTALALMVASAAHPVAGAAFVVGAAAIAVATVTGRYHFAADVVLGALLGFVGVLAAHSL